jgi:hypothetical protein
MSEDDVDILLAAAWAKRKKMEDAEAEAAA